MIKLPLTGFGTWQLREPELSAAIREAIATGYRHFDGAAIYENEAQLGSVFEKLIKEEQIITREEVNYRIKQFSHFISVSVSSLLLVNFG